MVEPLYQIKQKCTMCESEFQTSRVRPSFRKPLSRDSDFCFHYEDSENNPVHYIVKVCPYCGFAFTDSFSEYIMDHYKVKFKNEVTSKWTPRDYGGPRVWEDALETFKLALVTAQTVNESDQVIASLLHHIAWMYRFRKNIEQEKRFLTFALDAYVKVYESEDQVNDARLMFMLGELNRRLKRYEEAVKWFGRVVHDKKIVDAAMIGASREMWQLTIEEMKQSKTIQAD